MSSGGVAPRRKGSQWECDVRDYLRSRGYQADRAYGAGRPDDVGDIDGIPGFHIECKNHRRMDLAGWIDQASEGKGVPTLIVKRPRQPVGEAYVVMRLKDWEP